MEFLRKYDDSVQKMCKGPQNAHKKSDRIVESIRLLSYDSF